MGLTGKIRPLLAWAFSSKMEPVGHIAYAQIAAIPPRFTAYFWRPSLPTFRFAVWGDGNLVPVEDVYAFPVIALGLERGGRIKLLCLFKEGARLLPIGEVPLEFESVLLGVLEQADFVRSMKEELRDRILDFCRELAEEFGGDGDLPRDDPEALSHRFEDMLRDYHAKELKDGHY